MIKQMNDLWMNEIVPGLKKHGVELLRFLEFSEEDRLKLRDYFTREIYPILTPLAFDPGRPFPYISNLSLNLAILIKKPNGENHFARVKVPNIIPRLVQVDKHFKTEKKTGSSGKV